MPGVATITCVHKMCTRKARTRFAYATAILALAVMSPAHAGINEWTESGPDAASISGVEFAVPTGAPGSVSSVAYARGGDKFWKTTDAGATWTTLQRNNTLDYPFAVDPADPNVILLAGPSGPPLRSTDGGANFSEISPLPFWSLFGVGFGRDGVVYATASFDPHIHRSANHGQNWTTPSQNGLPTTPSSNLVPTPYNIAVSPDDSNVLYAAFRHPDYPGLYRSIDAGANWVAGNGLQGIAVHSIAIHPTTPSKIFIATPAGVYVSTDSGANWAKVPDPGNVGVATLGMQSVAIDPTNPQIVWAGGSDRGEIFRSADGGASWTRRDTGIVATWITSIAPRPGVSGDVLVGTSHTLYRTTDAGATWVVSARGIKSAGIGAIDNGSRLRVGLYDGGIYETEDGTNWTPLNNAALRDRVPNRKFSPVIEINDASRLFVTLEQDGVFASADRGASWLAQPASFNPFVRHNWGGLVTPRGTGPVHLVGTSDGIFRTTDDGNTWTRTFGVNSTSVKTMTKNTDGTHIFAGTFNGVYRSDDNGSSWQPVNNGLTNLSIKSLAYDPAGSNALMVGTNNGLFVTRDNGVSYTRLPDALGPGPQPSIDAILIEDFLHGSIYVTYQSRVFRSVDSGQSWIELAAGNPLSVFRGVTRLAGDGPGVLYVGAVRSGLHQYTVSPDMELIGQTPTAGTFPVGHEFAWQGTVRNNGPVAATGSKFSFVLHQNMQVISPSASRGQCTVSVSLVLCDFGVMQSGDTATVNLTVRGISGGRLRVEPMALSSELDFQTSNNSFLNTSVRILEQVDLTASLSVPAAPVNSGDAVEYVLTIGNAGTTIATGGEFETSFDPQDLYTLTANSSHPLDCPGTSPTPGVWRCPLPPIPAGGSVQYRWRVVHVAPGPRTASAVVRVNPENSVESTANNNSSSQATTVVPANDLSVSILPSATTVTRNGDLSYSVQVTNNGVIPINSVNAQVTLSNLVTYTSTTGATCSASGATLTCAIGTLAPSASHSFTVSARASTTGSSSTSASVSGSNPDPNAVNNSAAAAVMINDPPPAGGGNPTPPPGGGGNPTPPPSSGGTPPPASGGGSGGGGGSLDYLLLAGLLLFLAGRRPRPARA